MAKAFFRSDFMGSFTEKRLNIARQLCGFRKYSEAETVYNDLLGREPGLLAARIGMIEVFFRRGELEKASEESEKLIAEKGDSIELHDALGRLHMSMENWSRAVDHFKKCLELKPDFPEAYYNIGNIMAVKGYIKEALGYYDNALKLRFDYYDAWMNRGLVLKDLGRTEEAVDSFGRAGELKKDSPEPPFLSGNVYFKNNELEKAVSEFKKAAAIDPKYARAWFNMANSLNILGRREESIAAYNSALEADPKFSEASANLGFLYYESGDYSNALENFSRAVKENPADNASKHMVSALQGENTLKAPNEYVLRLFGTCPPDYEKKLAKLAYSIPKKLKAALLKSFSPKEDIVFKKVLDLGCGSGLCGAEFKDITGRLAGVDISMKMLEEAGTKMIYQNLLYGEIEKFLEKLSEKFDLFTAADVFVYTGCLESIFESVRRLSNEGSFFCFSTELAEGENDYVLRKSGRYAHSADYIRKLAAANSFVIERSESITIKRGEHEEISGAIYILKA